MKLFIISSLVIAISAWGFFGYIVWAVPPRIEGALVISNLVYFLISGGLGLALTAGLFIYFVGNFFLPKVRGVDPTHQLRSLIFRSLRRGFLFSILIVGLVGLNIFGLLNLLNAALVIGIVILAEIYFSSR
ncbi:hypothetical protein IH981_00100 [Patescibacteria group bacterium]|nr:hypothetical protein [Patescibacteria group bacterium]